MHISKRLSDAHNAGLKRTLRKITPISARECLLGDEITPFLDFSSNNYLGIANHPKLIEASIKATKKYGTSSKASRLVSGTFPEYLEIEDKIAKWKGYDAAIIIGSGYMANTGLIPAIANRKSAIFADKLNHASLNAGSQLSGAKVKRYSHNDLNILESRLKKSQIEDKIIISDTVFSMDGDFAHIEEIANLAKKYNALLYLDDAHATGLFSENGAGLANNNNANIAMGTFSKAMGAYGAYVACSSEFKEYFINHCSSFIYTTALPPSVYATISAAIDLVQTSEYCDIRKKLLKKSKQFASEIRSLGFEIGNTSSPIIPIIIPEPSDLANLANEMLDNHILALPIRPPTVPKHTARLRITLNASHTNNDLNRILDVLKEYKI